jgi:hypothetical protein
MHCFPVECDPELAISSRRRGSVFNPRFLKNLAKRHASFDRYSQTCQASSGRVVMVCWRSTERVLEAEVGIERGNLVVPILTNSKQFNRLRSFPSEIRLPEVFAKIKNYPEISVSKSSHYSSSIILLELLLEVVLVSSKFLWVRDVIPLPNDAAPDNPHSPCPVEPENLDFWTQISRICVPGNEFAHYPATIVQLSLRPILLAIAGGRTACWSPARTRLCGSRSITINSTRRLVLRQIANRASIEGFDLIESKARELSSSPGSK